MIPRKLKKVTGYVICEAVGPIPYETEEDKKDLQTAAGIIDEAVRAGHISFPEGFIGPQWGEGVTKHERTTATILNRHSQLNLSLLKSSAKIDRIMRIARAQKLKIVPEFEHEAEKKSLWQNIKELFRKKG